MKPTQYYLVQRDLKPKESLTNLGSFDNLSKAVSAMWRLSRWDHKVRTGQRVFRVVKVGMPSPPSGGAQ